MASSLVPCCRTPCTLARSARLAGSSPAAAQQQGLLWQRRRQRLAAAAPPAALPPSLAVLADLVAYPAAASEAFIDTTASIPEAAADAAADAAAAAAAVAAESDPSELVFTALFGIASESRPSRL